MAPMMATRRYSLSPVAGDWQFGRKINWGAHKENMKPAIYSPLLNCKKKILGGHMWREIAVKNSCASFSLVPMKTLLEQSMTWRWFLWKHAWIFFSTLTMEPRYINLRLWHLQGKERPPSLRRMPTSCGNWEYNLEGIDKQRKLSVGGGVGRREGH